MDGKSIQEETDIFYFGKSLRDITVSNTVPNNH